eukprot:s610_g12.t1
MLQIEKEAEDTGCSFYNFFQCNGFERTFINDQRKDSKKKIEEDIAYWESEIARGVTSTPKGQMRYSTMVRILKEFVQYIDEYAPRLELRVAEVQVQSYTAVYTQSEKLELQLVQVFLDAPLNVYRVLEDWRERIRERRLRTREAPMITEAKPMDVDMQRLTEQAWELRGHGDRCVAKDAAQAVRHYEWALDVLRPVPVEHAGPSRCALLVKLARCHLQDDRRFPADPVRCLQYLEQVKENDVNGSWQAESKKLREQALALGGQPAERGPSLHACYADVSIGTHRIHL